MSSFWSAWIIALTALQIVFALWLLFANRKKSSAEAETTGHVYDGLEEYNNPLPAWWFKGFVLTIVFGLGYLALFPGLGSFDGLLGWTSIDRYEERVETADAKYRAMRDRYLAMPVEEIAYDPAVRQMGQRLFGINCATCHGADAGGNHGYPNLTDDAWLYGGTVDAIKTTLVNGRQAAMPAWQSVLGDEGIRETTEYLLSLNNREADATLVEAGERHFQTYCQACHGAEAKGNPILGAPNLTNGIWLYGGSRDNIAETLSGGRNGVMPAFAETLSEAKIHILTAWVYGLRDQPKQVANH